jgi:hypothetical protein
MVHQIELWKARRTGRKQARNDFETVKALHVVFENCPPTPQADDSFKAYILEGLEWINGRNQ